MPTQQETFDTVVTHLLTQRQRSMDKDTYCLYRGPNNLKCAAGILIPDEEYLPKMENLCAYDGIVGSCLVRHGHDTQLVTLLQGIHDRFPVHTWEERLHNLAKDYGLTFNPPPSPTTTTTTEVSIDEGV